MTQYLQVQDEGNQNNAVGLIHRNSDSVVAPPFEGLDRLNNVSSRLDAAISTLIGQLQPYATDAPTKMLETMKAQPASISSPLENRIDAEIRALLEMAVRLEELIGSLRL